MRNISVIIAAAGSGARMGGPVPKQYLTIDGLPVLVRTVRAFCSIKDVRAIAVMCPPGDVRYCQDMLAEHLHACTSGVGVVPAVLVREGGDTRQQTVEKGLAAVGAQDPYVLVHDGARPFVSAEVIEGVIAALKAGAEGAVPCVRPKSTIRTAEETLDRSALYEVQTPQGFKTEVLVRAFEKAAQDGFTGTDEAGLAEHAGAKITITEGDYANVKITTREDVPEMMRCGNGYDVHRLVSGRKLMLGCVEVPYEKGLLGHSDADVCAHAIADALLGAAGLRDIGYWFPDTAQETEGMAGSELLAQTVRIIKERGFAPFNVDATIAAQRPKLSPYIEAMKAATAAALGIPVQSVGIKATTEEGLGITGGGEAISCYATATVR